MKKNKGVTLIETIVIIAILGIFGLIFLAMIGGGIPNSGQHTGIVTSVEKEGIIWQTYGAYIKTSAQATQEDKYCVTDSSVVAQLQDDAQQIKEVTVQYSRGFFVWPWQCGSESSIINSVK